MKRYWQKDSISNDKQRSFAGNFSPRKKSRQERPFKNSHQANELDPKTQGTINYYERIYRDLSKELQKDTKEFFSQNVLNESIHLEVEVCCHKSSSNCIEALLPICNNHCIMERFMNAFANKKEKVCSNPNASHIMEILIHYALKNLKNWNPDFSNKNKADDENSELIEKSQKWLGDFADFLRENFESCLTNPYSCHVACTLIRALGGDLSDKELFMSHHTKQHKQRSYESFTDEDLKKSLFYQPVVLEEIPKKFRKLLKKFAVRLMCVEDIPSFITDSSVATVFEALLLVLKKRNPKYSKKLTMHMAMQILALKDQDSIPVALLHKNSSYLIEEFFKASDEEVHHFLWQEYIVKCLNKLAIHHAGNFIVQRAFETVTNVEHFKIMCNSIWDLFEEILNSRCFGVFVSIANSCVRLKVQQIQFVESMMRCLHCLDSGKQLLLIPLLLGFQRCELYKATYPPTMHVCLQGSLTAQAILKFEKPIKAVESILNMKPSDLAFLAFHIQGCHVLNSYFATSNYIGEKNKVKLLNHMKPIIIDIICDRSGSLTLCRIWTLLSIKQKGIIMKELIENEETLRSDDNGNLILKKFGTFYFKKKYDRWIEMQNSLSSKKNEVK